MRFFRKRTKNTHNEIKSSHILKKPVPKTSSINGLVNASNTQSVLESNKDKNGSKKLGTKKHSVPKELDPYVTFGNARSKTIENVKQPPEIPTLRERNVSVNDSLKNGHSKYPTKSSILTKATNKYRQESSPSSSLSSDDVSQKIYKKSIQSKSEAKTRVNAPHHLSKSLYRQNKDPEMSSDETSLTDSSLSSLNSIVPKKNTSQTPQNFRPPPNPWQTSSSPNKTPQPKIHNSIPHVSSSSISSSSLSSSLPKNRYSSLKYPKKPFAKPQNVEKTQLMSNGRSENNSLYFTKQLKKVLENENSLSSSITSSQSSEKMRTNVSSALVTKKPKPLKFMKDTSLKISETKDAKKNIQQKSRLNQINQSSSFFSNSSEDVLNDSQALKKKLITPKNTSFKSSSSSSSFSSTFNSSQSFKKNNIDKKQVKKHPVMAPSVSEKRNTFLLNSVGIKPINVSNAGNNVSPLIPKTQENTIRKTIIVKKTEWIPPKYPMTAEIRSNTKQLGHFLYDSSSDSSSFHTNSVALSPKTIQCAKKDDSEKCIAKFKIKAQPIERVNTVEEKQLTPEKRSLLKYEASQMIVKTLKSSSISSLSNSSKDFVKEKVDEKDKDVEKKSKEPSIKTKHLRKNFKNRLSTKHKENVMDTSSHIKSLQTTLESIMKETLQKYEKQKTNDDLKKDLGNILQNQLNYFEKRSQETQSQHINTLIKSTRKELQNFVKKNMISSLGKEKISFNEKISANPSNEEMVIFEKALKRFHEDQRQIMHDFFNTKSMLWETQLEHLKNTLLERNNTLKLEVTNSMKECMLSLSHKPKEIQEKLNHERFQEKTQFYEKQLNLLHESFVQELRNSKKESDQLYQSTVEQMQKLLDRKHVKLEKYKKILNHLLDVNQIVRKRVDRMELNKKNLVQKLKESYVDQERFTLALKQCVPLDTTLQMAGHGLLKGQALQKLSDIVTKKCRQLLLYVFIQLKINIHLQKPYALYQKPIQKTLTGLHTKLLTHNNSHLQNVLNLSWLPMCSVLLEKQAGFMLTWVDYLSNSIKIKHQIWVFSRLRAIIKLHRATVAQRTCMEHFAYYLNNFISFVVFRNKYHVFVSLTRILCVSLDPHVPPHYAKAFTLKYDEKNYFKWLPKTDALNKTKQGKWIQTTPQLPHQYIVAERLNSKEIPKLLSYKPLVYNIPLELPKTIPLLYNAHKI